MFEGDAEIQLEAVDAFLIIGEEAQIFKDRNIAVVFAKFPRHLTRSHMKNSEWSVISFRTSCDRRFTMI